MFPQPARTLAPIHPKYDRQIIINITDSAVDIPFLIQKSERKHHFKNGTCGMQIQLTSNDNPVYDGKLLADALQDPYKDSYPRIYISGHCNSGLNILAARSGSKSATISTTCLVNMIDQALPVDSKFRTDNTHPNADRLKISLIACSAGVGNNTTIIPGLINNSFAAQLLHAFKIKGINCQIAARLNTVYIFKHKLRAYVKLQSRDASRYTYHPRHDNTAKIIYQYNCHGCQEIIPAYSGHRKTLWRQQVFQTISAYLTTSWEYKRQLLIDLQAKIIHLNDYDIFIALSNVAYQLEYDYSRSYHYYLHQALQTLIHEF